MASLEWIYASAFMEGGISFLFDYVRATTDMRFQGGNER